MTEHKLDLVLAQSFNISARGFILGKDRMIALGGAHASVILRGCPPVIGDSKLTSKQSGKFLAMLASEPEYVCSISWHQLFIWASKRELAASACDECDRIDRRLGVGRRIGRSAFDRELVREALQAFVELCPGTDHAVLELRPYGVGSVLTLTCGDITLAICSLNDKAHVSEDDAFPLTGYEAKPC